MMRKGMAALMLAGMVVTGCASVRESSVNPFNWFGSSKEERAVAVKAKDDPYGGRNQVAEVVALTLEPTRGGAIVKASGLPPTQGWYDAELVREPSEDPSELVFRFVLKAPSAAMRQGSPYSREITVATFLNDFALEGVNSIKVTGAQNSRAVRRR